MFMDSKIQCHKKCQFSPTYLQINAVPIKIEMGHFIELDKPILKYTWKFQEPRRQFRRSKTS